MKNTTKARLEGILIGAVLTAVISVTAYNTKPIGNYLNQAFQEGNSQYGEALKNSGETYIPIK